MYIVHSTDGGTAKLCNFCPSVEAELILSPPDACAIENTTYILTLLGGSDIVALSKTFLPFSDHGTLSVDGD